MFVEWMDIVAIMELESKLLREYHKMKLEFKVPLLRAVWLFLFHL